MTTSTSDHSRAVFLFLYFLFSFFTKIYFRFGNLQEYTPTAQLPGGRDLAARQRGGRGISEKNFAEKIARRSLGTGRPAAGRPALAARLQGDRLSHPYIRVGWSPPLICITKIPETKKKEGGRERGEALPDFRAGDCGYPKFFYALQINYVVTSFVEIVD